MGMLSSLQSSSVQLLSSVWFFAISWTVVCQAYLSITNSWSLLKLMSKESVMPCNHLILVIPFSSHLQSFAASGSFPMSWLFASGGQSTGVSASASVLPMNIQDWFLSGWTGWISLQSKELSRVFCNTTVQKHQFFGIQFSLFSLHFSSCESYLSAMVWMFVPCPLPTNSYVVILIPKGDDRSRWGLWEVISSKRCCPHEWDLCYFIF